MKVRLELPSGLDGLAMLYARRRQPLAPPRTHRHSELEVNLVVRGHLRYLVDQRHYLLDRGTLLWLLPQQEHVLVDASDDAQMWVICFRPRVVRRWCAGPQRQVLRRGRPPATLIKRLRGPRASRLDEVYRELSESADDPDLFNALLGYALLASWREHLEGSAMLDGADVHPAVQRAAQLLRDQPSTGGLDEIARQAGLSRSRLSTLFKQQTGMSLVSYRQRQCIDRFFTLATTRDNFLHAAHAAGFGSYAQFHRVFKSVVGCSPAQWKKRRG